MSVVLSRTIGEVAELRLNNSITNVIDTRVVRSLRTAMEHASRSCRAIVLCGGDRFFSNGADLQWAIRQDREGMDDMFHALCDLVLFMLEAPLPIVGAMKGHAVGGGKRSMPSASGSSLCLPRPTWRMLRARTSRLIPGT